MALEINDVDLVQQGTQHYRRGAQYDFEVNISNRNTAVTESVTTASVTVTRQKDETTVTNTFFPTGSVTYSGQVITLPTFVIPTTTLKGEYIITVQYTAGALVNDRPAIKFFVTD